MKRQPTGWENILANDVTDKGLVSKIYKQLMMFNSIKQTTHSKNGQMDLTDILQRKHTDGQQAYGKMFDNTIIREMQIKITMRQHLTLAKMTIIKKSTKNKCWIGCSEKGTFLHC